MLSIPLKINKEKSGARLCSPLMAAIANGNSGAAKRIIRTVTKMTFAIFLKFLTPPLVHISY